MAQVMFETFHTPAAYIAEQAVLSLYASGRTSGVVFDCGLEMSRAVPVYEGYGLPHAIVGTQLGGVDLTTLLRELLNKKHWTFSRSHSDCEIVRDIQETLTFVTANFDDDQKSLCEEKSYKLPDGQVITVGNERFLCPEALFQPSLTGHEYPGIHSMVTNAILKCDADGFENRLFYGNIVVSGGASSFSGIVSRLQKEITSISPPLYRSRKVSVTAPANRKLSPWIGGSILASLRIFQQCWVSRQEYEEQGPAIVRRKCI